VRRKVFNQKFCCELTPVAAAAGVNSYWPGEYIRWSEKMPFIAEVHPLATASNSTFSENK
jgi:hypothetical protein